MKKVMITSFIVFALFAQSVFALEQPELTAENLVKALAVSKSLQGLNGEAYQKMFDESGMSEFNHFVLSSKISIGYQQLLEEKYGEECLFGDTKTGYWGDEYFKITITDNEKEVIRPYMDEVEEIKYGGEGYAILFQGWHVDPKPIQQEKN